MPSIRAVPKLDLMTSSLTSVEVGSASSEIRPEVWATTRVSTDTPIGIIITAVAVFAWRATRTATRSTWLPLAVILAGAVANLIDRASDGVVTDYLHTGWFPTFNLADVYITGGAITLMVAALTSGDRTENPTAAEL